MVVPITAGILSALRRVLARRVSLKVISASLPYRETPSKSMHHSFLYGIDNHHHSILLQNQLKRRLHAITIASATCFLFPFAMWDTILVSTYHLCSNYFCGWEDLQMIPSIRSDCYFLDCRAQHLTA